VKIGDGAIKFPDADGTANQMMTTNGSAQLAFVAQPTSGFTLGTEVDTTSGTDALFSSIPSGTTMIVIMFEGVSLTANTALDLTLGDSGGLETSGYVGHETQFENGTGPVQNESTAEFLMGIAASANTIDGMCILTLKDSTNFTWSCSFSAKMSANQSAIASGTKSLSAELTQVNLGGGTFDAGSINIMYQ